MITLSNKKAADGNEAQAFGSFAIPLADDESAMLALPVDYGHVLVAETSLASHGMAWVRSSNAVKYFGGANFAVASNTVLSGTTGVDGNMTVSTNAGNFYIENRTGAAVTLSITFLGIASNRI